MLTKSQKTWLLLFLISFLMPEIIYQITLKSLFILISTLKPGNIFDFFITSQIPFVALISEWIGIIGILIMGIRSNKKSITILSIIALTGLFLTILFILGFIFVMWLAYGA